MKTQEEIFELVKAGRQRIKEVPSRKVSKSTSEDYVREYNRVVGDEDVEPKNYGPLSAELAVSRPTDGEWPQQCTVVDIVAGRAIRVAKGALSASRFNRFRSQEKAL